MKSVALHNLGCKVNAYEIEVMQQNLQESGFEIVPFDSEADIYIVNTTDAASGETSKSRCGGRGGGMLCADRSRKGEGRQLHRFGRGE